MSIKIITTEVVESSETIRGQPIRLFRADPIYFFQYCPKSDPIFFLTYHNYYHVVLQNNAYANLIAKQNYIQ